MKECPKCKSEIQENAHFCLYCMTSFEEKQVAEPMQKRRRWLIWPIAAWLLALAVSGVCFSCAEDVPVPSSDSAAPSVTSASTDANSMTVETPTAPTKPTATITTTNGVGGSVPANRVPSTGSTSPTKESAVAPTTSSAPKTNVSTASDAASATTSSATGSAASSTRKSSTSVSVSTSATATTTAAPAQAATYLYREAVYGDTYATSEDLENSIVIIGVKTPATDGNYVIPATIEGKKVIAVMGLAFCDEEICASVKSVVIPTSVKTVWNYAFASCYRMTDIYLQGKSVYIESIAFADPSHRSEMLTIHCAADCSDRSFRFYKDCAHNYNAVYQEWNG